MTRIADYKDHVNADGLRIRYGTGQAQVGRGGTYAHEAGSRHMMEIEVVGTDLTAFGATEPATILDYEARIPEDVFLERAEFQVHVDFVGATATLSFGLTDASDQSSPFTPHSDDIGIDDTIAVTALQIGDTMPIVCDGALISTVLGSDAGGYLVTATAGTADFTAGIGVLRVWYRTLPEGATTDLA